MIQISPTSFLQRVWPQNFLRDETLELRAIRRKDNSIKRKFLTSIDEFLTTASEYGDEWDIYFGVSTRFQKGGKKQDCYRIKCVWVDLDKPETPSFVPVKPDIIVKSGTGSHVYWTLRDPLFIRAGRWKEIEAVNRGLCKKFGGDIASIDVTRILRVPGFKNWKYDPPIEVKAYVQD